MNREQLLAYCGVQPRREPVEGLDGVYMTMADHATNRETQRLTAFGKRKEADRLVICRFLVNEEGERIFQTDDDEAIDQLSAIWGNRILDAYYKANRLEDQVVDELEKNSEADRT